MHSDKRGTTATMQCANSAGARLASWASSARAPARACHLRPCAAGGRWKRSKVEGKHISKDAQFCTGLGEMHETPI